MPWLVIGVVAVVLIIYAPRLMTGASAVANAAGARETRDACAALRAAIDALPQGTDPNTRADLEAQLRACETRLESFGEVVDRVSSTLATCTSRRDQIRREWSHYLSTSYSDAIKRNNTRSAILRFAEEALQCLEGARELGTTSAELKAVRKVARDLHADAVARFNAYVAGAPGTGRFAWNEDDNPVKARAEDDRVIKPLKTFLGSLDSQIKSLEQVENEAKAAAERARREAERAAEIARKRAWQEQHGHVVVDALAQAARLGLFRIGADEESS